MPIVQNLNSKGNIKKSTTNDIPYTPSFPVVSYANGVTTAGQTVFNLGFTVNTAVAGNHHFTLDGKLLTPGTTNDYQFTGTNAAGYSSQITLNAGFPTVPVNLNWQASLLGVKPENQFQLDNRFVQLYAAQSAGFNGFIDTSYTLAPTTTAGTPAAGTFYSTIPNRASIVDISQDLRPSFGIERIPVQQIAQLQTEFGPNGEPVFALVNDDRGLVRFVGPGWKDVNTASLAAEGQQIVSTVSGDYCEITFYGTGLNILTYVTNIARDLRATVDGGTEGTSFYPASGSGVLASRNYAMNTVINVASGLSLGIHTVKIRNAHASANALISGFEVLNTNSTTALNVNPGVSYVGGQKLSAAAATALTYNTAFDSGTLGTTGGHVVVYQKADGTIGKAVTPTPGVVSTFASASHSNEEIYRTYNFREFGAGRTDDFSLLGSSALNAAFTLDDGTTTLVGSGLTVSNYGSSQALAQSTNNTYFTITFVGTGLDILWTPTATGTNGAGQIQVVIDGGSAINWPVLTATSGVFLTQKVCSGLPYGTHTVKFIVNTSTGFNLAVKNFITYQPKKPSIPTGAVELADYNVMATYVANSTSGAGTIGTGTLRKQVSIREATYSGTWTVNTLDPLNYIGGFGTYASASGSYCEYTFFGTGFEYRGQTNTTHSSNVQVAIDGVNLTTTNYPAVTASTYGTTFTPSTGILSTNGSLTYETGFTVSGLTLGIHKVRFTVNDANFFYMESLDIITPVYSAKSNLNYDQQNTLPVGSNALSDNRKTSPIKDLNLQKKNTSQAFGLNASATTSSTAYVPMPDMSCIVQTSGNALRISYSVSLLNTAGAGAYYQVFVDGIPVGVQQLCDASGASILSTAQVQRVNVSPGQHKVDLYWKVTSGTQTLYDVFRNLLVEEV